MTDRRLGDKHLPFKDCENCGAGDVDLYVIRGVALCEDCTE